MSYGYITKLSENVERQHIRYNNRYRTAIAADIYTPKNLEEDRLLPAIVIRAPYGKHKGTGSSNLCKYVCSIRFCYPCI